ncbi:MAG: T9SS type A sorting domain-containing protein [Bacteroidetes bacterium]|nr:MAG: T9SS type A sorting domain-containing protein [Bacteroidota bacterium]
MFTRILFFLMVSIFVSMNAIAQCVPDSSVTHNTSGIYPDSATGLPHAFVGVPYSTVIYVYVPTDTVYLNLPVTIVSIDVTGVTGLPPGFSYTCTPSNCVFPGGTNACLTLQGPAPTSGMIGNYPLVVEMDVNGLLSGFPQTIQESNDNYTIVIENTTGLWTVSNGTFSVKQNSPNPVNRFTRIPVNSKVNGTLFLKFTDILGNVVLQEEREVQKGINNLLVDAANFEAGIYLYTVSDGKSIVTRRLIVSGKNDF